MVLDLARQQHRPGTGSEDRPTGTREGLERVVQSDPLEALCDRGALTAGQDQGVDPVQVLAATHPNGARAHATQRLRVGIDIPLNR